MAKFLVQIGDNKVELEGATRDDAIKRVGLNPQYWKENKGENMTKEKQKETTSTTENTPKKRLATPLKDKSVVVRQRRKPNITTEDIGKWFTDGTDVWRLDVFIPEPQVSMSKVVSLGGDPEKHEIKKGNLSDFENFCRLIPAPENWKRVKKQG
ncbi:MAG: hypothetical protein ACLPVI_11965 [Dehalococcoidales bacterium]